jgi:ribosomal protein S18 acetylase RimI-like enzyme
MMPVMANDDQSSDVAFQSGGSELLPLAEPLWTDLRRHHARLSPQWSVELLAARFSDRQAALIAKSAGGLLVVLAQSAGQTVGYCICTISAEGQGEIDSLYVAPQHRRRGIGGALVKAGMTWLGSRPTKLISVEVMESNEEAKQLYARFGFHGRTVRMKYLGGDSQ